MFTRIRFAPAWTCRILLHLVDILPGWWVGSGAKCQDHHPWAGRYSPELAAKPRWLVFNKLDLVLEEEADGIIARVVKELEWTGPVYRISAFDKQGTNLSAMTSTTCWRPCLGPKSWRNRPEKVEFKWDDYRKGSWPGLPMMIWMMTMIRIEAIYDVEVIYTR